jgi:hypothetical protein
MSLSKMRWSEVNHIFFVDTTNPDNRATKKKEPASPRQAKELAELNAE